MIKSLTSLRGIFILFIFFHHCMDLYSGGGTMAVTFFFVLGGFSMTLGYKDYLMLPSFNYKQYLARRFIKFYPLHWLCLLAALPFALASFNISQLPVFIVNGALLHSWIHIKSVYISYNAVSWYLADTMFFTVVFPLLFRWIANRTFKGRVLIATLMLITYMSVVMMIPEDMYHAILYIGPYMRLMDFVFGIFLALCYLKLKNKSQTKWNNTTCHILIFSLIILLVVESCILPENARLVAPIYWLPVAFLILVSSLSECKWGGQNLLQNRIFLRLGELSFTIYMVHQIVLRYTARVYGKVFHLESDVVYVIFTLTMTIFVSYFVNIYILNPITQWLTKRIQPSTIAHS